MKKFYLAIMVMVTITFLTLLAGCHHPSTGSTSAPGPFKSLTVTVAADQTVYYSLSTGQLVALVDTKTAANSTGTINSTDWDIAFGPGTQGVFTNSGATATAAASNGKGGVWYSGTTDFDAVTAGAIAGLKDDAPWANDASVWTKLDYGPNPPKGAPPAVAQQYTLNIMTYLEYVSGDGTNANPYINDSSSKIYSGPAYYAYGGQSQSGQGGIMLTNEVYILRHGNGTSYSKVQILGMSGTGAKRDRVIKYWNLK